MERFEHAYARALFPRGARVDAGSADEAAARGRQSVTLAADGLDLAIGAGIYRLVNAVEDLWDGLRQRQQPSATGRVPTATRVGCG